MMNLLIELSIANQSLIKLANNIVHTDLIIIGYSYVNITKHQVLFVVFTVHASTTKTKLSTTPIQALATM
jgi:hypothetical protein